MADIAMCALIMCTNSYADKYRNVNNKPDSWQSLIGHVEALQAEVCFERKQLLTSAMELTINCTRNSLSALFEHCYIMLCLMIVLINGLVHDHYFLLQ
jgi:hypothetical protein